MKQPKISNLKYDSAGTQKIREQISKTKKIKITINMDADVLNEVKKLADKTETPYQKLLNKIVKESLLQKEAEESRIDKLEKEVSKIKKKLAA
ncbi:MAG: hypothetical protein JXA66_05715 [Oligoflexia bacterium]|nr:hypothetical protein [Oligoflexia bacterium]